MRCIKFILLLAICLSPTLAYATGSLTPAAGGAGTVIVSEDDGSPSVTPSIIKFTDTTVTDNGDGSVSVAIGGAEVDTLDTVFDRGKVIDGANSAANAVQIGDGTDRWLFYKDSSAGLIMEPNTAQDSRWRCMLNKNCILFDVEGDAAIETVDPDAATQLGKYTYGTAYKPLKTIPFMAGSLYGDGTQCPADPTTVTINGGPKISSFICTDNDAATLYGSIKMPDGWDGGTVTFEHIYIQTAVNTGALNGDIAAQCRGNGEAPSSTWGTEVAIDDAAVTGSNQNDFTTSAAVTPAGTCAGGDMLYFRYQLDATGTTTTIASLHHVGFKMEYAVTSRSD